MERYLLDSNIFITSEHYIPMDLFPSFWGELEKLFASGTAVLHQSVLDELKRKKDPLVDWIRNLQGFKPLAASQQTLDRYLEVCSWARGQGTYSKRAIREFEADNRADAWLCAEAWASDMTLVTYETRSNSPNKVKIPDVCSGLGIKCMDGFEFMRTQGFRF
ncbi:MAG: DUF4411 family protein [Ellagibacter isourolithinifaciens]|nr:DUF4411 family protein [Eggerthellaceae bacterium]MDY4123038.1 DUF4411 family protein [Ellagibacter isourolithinifaciens]